jgi:hypothetical protein
MPIIKVVGLLIIKYINAYDIAAIMALIKAMTPSAIGQGVRVSKSPDFVSRARRKIEQRENALK